MESSCQSELFHSFLTEIEHPDLLPLQWKAVAYPSQYTAEELSSSMADSICAALKTKVNQSPFVIVLIDESTDIINHKWLFVYVKIIDPESFEPCTHFHANKVCVYPTGAGISICIQEVMSELKILLTKVMSMGSESAAIMTGRNKSCIGPTLTW